MPKTDKMADVLQEERYRSNRRKGMPEADAVKNSLTSMKRESPKPIEAPDTPHGDEYPYGLAIRLEGDDLDKLGLKKLPNVSSKVKLQAAAIVKSISSNQSMSDEGEKRCLELQITDMQLGKGAADDDDSASEEDTNE